MKTIQNWIRTIMVSPAIAKRNVQAPWKCFKEKKMNIKKTTTTEQTNKKHVLNENNNQCNYITTLNDTTTTATTTKKKLNRYANEYNKAYNCNNLTKITISLG